MRTEETSKTAHTCHLDLVHGTALVMLTMNSLFEVFFL